ncbi:MAG: phage tail sheath subtilisin-like domain-containing protein [Proteobacteria bacterium]|nr:phage tail sheath subtilisin-like domain-containing protein [Pseudomonadota bacterium]
MMTDYKTPGVYVVEKSVLPASVAGVSTAIPAFVGYTQKAGVGLELVKVPTRITNLSEFEEKFGMAPSQEIGVAVNVNVDDSHTITGVTPGDLSELMHYALQMYFLNGGEACYIVSVGSSTSASSADFIEAIQALETEDEPTILVPVDGVNIADGTGNHEGQIIEALQQCAKLKDRFVIADVKTSGDAVADASAFRSSVGMNNLKYGAAYYPYLESVLPYQFTDDKVTITYSTIASVVTTPDDPATPDVDETVTENQVVETTGTLEDIKNSKTDLYNRIVKEIAKYSVTLPPSSAVAGMIASVDRDRGVWKAPANVSLAGVKGPVLKLTEDENDGLNVEPENGKSINAIRVFSGKGTLVWGARTLAGNDNEWRYVSVRRLFNYVEESIQKATSFSVFEPNTAMTWLKVRTMIESFLDTLWRQGALAGAKAEDAYFVQAGLGVTMTSQDILEGRLIVKVGLAAVRPAEFIILEFTHKLQES